MNIQEAVRNLTKQFQEYSYDGCLPEACHAINQASRDLIKAFIDTHGSCVTYKVNRYGGEKTKPIFKKVCDASEVKNFGASFVLESRDPELERMLLEREASPYTGATEDATRIKQIHLRVHEIDGEILLWT